MCEKDGSPSVEAQRLVRLEAPVYGSAFLMYLSDRLLDTLVTRLEKRKDHKSAEMVEALAVLVELSAQPEGTQVPGLVNRQAGEVIGEVSRWVEWGT